MTNEDIWRIALEQSAVDLNCQPEDFLRNEYVITESKATNQARKYLPLPFDCDMVSYGNNIVATIHPAYKDIVESYLAQYPVANALETPHLQALNTAFAPHNKGICFMAEYFLPDVDRLIPLSCPYELHVLEPRDFQDLYIDSWSNALCEARKHLDVLAIGAYDNGSLIGLAGCSADCETMWQIGVDVLPAYREQGVASALTSRLAFEILERGKVPFYCSAWCNVKSVRNAIKCGFKPAWVEVTIRSNELIEKLNKI